MNKKNTFIVSSLLLAMVAPMGVFAQEATSTTPSATQAQERYDRDHDRDRDDNRGDRDNNRGDRDWNRGDRDGRDRHDGDRDRRDRDHNWWNRYNNWNRYNWNRPWYNPLNGWNRNTWRSYNWRDYNWRMHPVVSNVITGVVAEASPSSALVVGSNGVTYLVGTANARIVDDVGAPLPPFSIRAGDRVVVSGIQRGTTIYATLISNLSF